MRKRTWKPFRKPKRKIRHVGCIHVGDYFTRPHPEQPRFMAGYVNSTWVNTWVNVPPPLWWERETDLFHEV